MGRRESSNAATLRRLAAAGGERGYALLSLLAAMTISLVVLAGALPSLKHEMQREREEEMYWRGQQVATALVRYQQAHGGQFPSRLEDLANDYVVNGKKIHFVRPSALRDPMTAKGDWRPVRIGDPLIGELALAVMTTTKQPLPPGSWLAQLAATQSGAVAKDATDDKGKPTSAFTFSSPGFNSESGPIVGVVSRSKQPTIRNYYGMETYDRCLIIQGVQMPGQFAPPMAVGGGGRPTATPDPVTKRCPPGQICEDPNCTLDMQRRGVCRPGQR